MYPVAEGNDLLKYADDTYLIVPAENSPSCEDELHYIKQWATANNLHLNQSKSAEIIFLSRGTRSIHVEPPSLITGIKRVNSIKALGVTLSSELSMSAHVCSILESCSRAMYGLRTLTAHGMQKECLHEVFRSTILARLTYASPAWSGFCSADDIKKLDSFINKSKKSDYCNPKYPPVKQLFAEADTSLFKSVLTNRNHLLYPLLPAVKTQHYELRTRSHNLTLTRKSCHYDNCNFISRMIFYNVY